MVQCFQNCLGFSSANKFHHRRAASRGFHGTAPPPAPARLPPGWRVSSALTPATGTRCRWVGRTRRLVSGAQSSTGSLVRAAAEWGLFPAVDDSSRSEVDAAWSWLTLNWVTDNSLVHNERQDISCNRHHWCHLARSLELLPYLRQHCGDCCLLEAFWFLLSTTVVTHVVNYFSVLAGGSVLLCFGYQCTLQLCRSFALCLRHSLRGGSTATTKFFFAPSEISSCAYYCRKKEIFVHLYYSLTRFAQNI